MKETYYNETPLKYIQRLTPLDYGQFQDVFVNFAQPMIRKLKPGGADKKLKIVDLGCLYGNSSLALMDKLTWNDTISFWLNKDEKIKNKDKYKVIGGDLSEEALLYGLERGIYDEIFVQDFNRDFNHKLEGHIVNADILMCLMATNYMYQGRWKEIINQLFLKNRNEKDKLLFYNQVCLFQTEDISPNALLNEQCDWNLNKIFTKHRLLTPQESEANNLNKESWTYLYGVKCDKSKL